ncbi:hypothetical protein CS542_04175 [Pedobacter sp. IW39]|nr:hypothetical protein CS542_04175 [Pedobacter sp. IW39]
MKYFVRLNMKRPVAGYCFQTNVGLLSEYLPPLIRSSSQTVSMILILSEPIANGFACSVFRFTYYSKFITQRSIDFIDSITGYPYLKLFRGSRLLSF